MSDNHIVGISETDQTKDHLFLIQSFLKHVASNKNICAVGIGGSFANGTADKWSDVDMYPFFNKMPSYAKATDLIEKWIEKMEKCIALRDRGYMSGFGYKVQVIFENLVRLDFNLNDFSSVSSSRIWASRKVLIDKDGALTAFLEHQKAIWCHKKIREESIQQIERIDVEFWVEYQKAVKCLDRGSLWSSLMYLQRLREILFFVIRIRYDCYGVNPDRPFKSIEKELGEKANNRILRETAPCYSKESIARGIFSCVDEYTRILGMLGISVSELMDATRRLLPPERLI